VPFGARRLRRSPALLWRGAEASFAIYCPFLM
jgi:hypothetical protein